MPLPLAPRLRTVAQVNKTEKKVTLAGKIGPHVVDDPTGELVEGQLCAVCQGKAYPLVSYSPKAPAILSVQDDRQLESYLHFTV